MFGWIKRLGRKQTPQYGLKAPQMAEELSKAVRAGYGDPSPSRHLLAGDEDVLHWGYVEPPPAVRLARRMAHLQDQIATAKRQKKKHSHLSAELARLEKDSTQ